MSRIAPTGPTPARIMLVGELPSQDDLSHGKPFMGVSGQELSRMLNEAGIARHECYITNVCKERPAGGDTSIYFADRAMTQARPVMQNWLAELQAEIAACQPNIIITFGALALWALTGEQSISSWRGSVLEHHSTSGATIKLLPTYSPAAVLRMWDWRNIVVHDLRRAERESHFPEICYPDYHFTFPAEFSEAVAALNGILTTLNDAIQPLRLAVDIETIRHEIACIGFALSSLDAVCIPIRTSKEYWALDEEIVLVGLIRAILTHPNAKVTGQNYLYDSQYFARKWGINSNLVDDTMFMQHVMWAGIPKDLAFLASMYCDFYQYWKDDLKDYKRAPEDDLKFFKYNCRDVCYTYEIAEECTELLDRLQLASVYSFQMRLWHAVFDMMLRGVRIDQTNRNKLAEDLMREATIRSDFITTVVGYELNPRSSKQMQHFLYEELRLPQIRNRKTGAVTANFEALTKLCEKEPLLYPIADALIEQRSIGVFLSTFVQAQLDEDQRMRCSFNPAGTETYRFSSSENAFGSGTNLQNIPKGDRKKTKFRLPNIRNLFVPDAGKIIFDVDLDRADLQVVVWEADDAAMKQMLRENVDMHIENAKVLFPTRHITKDSFERQVAKQFCHGTNYGGSARTMAATCGLLLHEAERAQSRWFAAHPGIRRWHIRTEQQLMTTRTVTNKFGYRRYYFGRIEELLSEALAWIPQSTVACVINRGLVNISEQLPEVELLLQVHDSLVGQYRKPLETSILPRMHELLLIPIDYPDPLIIPVGLKTSSKSWGECKDKDWDDGTQTE